jgi:hypothetical protein
MVHDHDKSGKAANTVKTGVSFHWLAKDWRDKKHQSGA